MPSPAGAAVQSPDLAALHSLMLQELTVQDPRLAPSASFGILQKKMQHSFYFLLTVSFTQPVSCNGFI